MTNNTVLNITEITLADGTVKFMPRGQKEPDTIETLERDGARLIPPILKPA